MKSGVSFIIAVNEKKVFENTFLRSPALGLIGKKEVLVKGGFPSAAKAYNQGIDEAKNELLIFIHQDVFLPETWPGDLSRALNYLEGFDKNWGVLGSFGKTKDGRSWGNLYSTGLQGYVGGSFVTPRVVQTLDEIVLIIRKPSGLRFDEEMPHFHLYGADICLTAEIMKMRNYAIDAFCIHNSNQVTRFPKEFFECCRFIKNKYAKYLPIQSSCIRITQTSGQYYKHRIRQALVGWERGKTGNARRENVLGLWEKLRLKVRSGEEFDFEG